jgi:hypothetical protein
MNWNVYVGWFWIVTGTSLGTYYFYMAGSHGWRTIMGPWDSILIIGGSLLLTICGIIKVRRSPK